MSAPTNTVLAAIDSGASAHSVIKTAIRVAEMIGAEVVALHVGEGPAENLETVTRSAAVPLRRLAGPVNNALLEAMEAPEVLAMVIGVGVSPGDGLPVGPTARHVVEHATKPVVVVPTDSVPPRIVQRLLVPLEGTEASSRPVLDILCPLLVRDVDLVVLHVFTDRTLPRMLDRPNRDLELLGREFLAAHCPRATRIELRRGPVATMVSAVSYEHGADLIVLSWSQDSSEGRAQIIREVLGASALPVLLLPARSKRRGG